ncbi:MAG: site-specific integrase [Candidatus Bathyarchaeia archaeon]
MKIGKKVLRVHRGIPVSNKDVQRFKEGLRVFIEKNLDRITCVEDLKRFVGEFCLKFTGEGLPERETKKEENLFKGYERGTLGWLLGVYMEETKYKVSSATLEINKYCAKRVLSKLGAKSLEDLTYIDLLNYQMQRKEEGISNRTINMEIGLIRKALNWALDVGLILGHNIKKFPMLPEHKKVFYFLTPSELKALLQALNHHPVLKARVLLTVLTGLRPKEVANLEWKDIDFENGLLFVRKKPGSQVKDREERVIPLGKEIIEILKELKALNPSSNFVFGKNGRPVYEISPQLRRASKRAGLEKKVSPYMLRHTFAVNALRAGIDIYSLKELMGHSSITTTERYLHADPNHLKTSIEKLNSYLLAKLKGDEAV